MYLVTVCACHIKIKGYLLTYLLNYLHTKFHLDPSGPRPTIQPFSHNTPTSHTGQTGHGQTGQKTVRQIRANCFTNASPKRFNTASQTRRPCCRWEPPRDARHRTSK